MIAVGLTTALPGQENPRPDLNETKKMGMGTPSPIDKMMAINQILGKGGINWSEVFSNNQVDVDPDNLSDQAELIPIWIGIRMSDGVLAIMARDTEHLNAVSQDIEKLAEKVGVEAGELSRAKKVRTYANRGEWPRVFLELGWLQKDVLDTLADDGFKGRKALVLASGWLQGARTFSKVVDENYSEDTGELLREPLLIDELTKSLQGCEAINKEGSITAALATAIASLKEPINVPMLSPVPQADVKKIRKITEEFVSTLHTKTN